MRLITNRIFTAKPTKTIPQLLKSAQAKAMLEKTASFDKEADKEWFEKNVLNKGEESDKKPEEKKKGEEKEGCDEAGMTATSKVTGEVKIKTAEEEKKGKDQATYDGGKVEGELASQPKPCKEGSNCAPEKKEDPQPKAPATTKTEDGTFPSSGQPQAEAKLVNVPRMPTDKDVHASAKGGTTESRFVRIANLTDKQKTYLKDYWKNLFPAEYVENMVVDK